MSDSHVSNRCTVQPDKRRHPLCFLTKHVFIKIYVRALLAYYFAHIHGTRFDMRAETSSNETSSNRPILCRALATENGVACKVQRKLRIKINTFHFKINM